MLDCGAKTSISVEHSSQDVIVLRPFLDLSDNFVGMTFSNDSVGRETIDARAKPRHVLTLAMCKLPLMQKEEVCREQCSAGEQETQVCLIFTRALCFAEARVLERQDFQPV